MHLEVRRGGAGAGQGRAKPRIEGGKVLVRSRVIVKWEKEGMWGSIGLLKEEWIILKGNGYGVMEVEANRRVVERYRIVLY